MRWGGSKGERRGRVGEATFIFRSPTETGDGDSVGNCAWPPGGMRNAVGCSYYISRVTRPPIGSLDQSRVPSIASQARPHRDRVEVKEASWYHPQWRSRLRRCVVCWLFTPRRAEAGEERQGRNERPMRGSCEVQK